jgi:hypothetical protein
MRGGDYAVSVRAGKLETKKLLRAGKLFAK